METNHTTSEHPEGHPGHSAPAHGHPSHAVHGHPSHAVHGHPSHAAHGHPGASHHGHPEGMQHKIKMPVHNKAGLVLHGENPWKAKVCERPIVDAFPEAIHTHPGVGHRPIMPPELPKVLEGIVESPRKMKTTAYLHVPYCETRCLYCMFYNKPYKSKEESKVFADYLIRDMRLWADKPVQKDAPVHAVYFGGGTPTVLEADDIKRIFAALKEHLPLANDCEITFEGSLSHFTDEKMDACIESGVNRFSLGVQTFDTKVRQAVGRLSTGEEAAEKLKKLASYDEAAVVIDLIYGFPFQTMESWENDIRIAQELGIDGADCYQLRVFPKAPLYKYIENGKLPAGPDHELRCAMFEKSVELFTKAHWNRLSISHWSVNRRERNFYNYFAKGTSDCLAFGPAAGGSLHGHTFMTHRKVEDWMAALDKGVKPVMMMMDTDPTWWFSRSVLDQMELNYLNPAQLAKQFSPRVETLWTPLLDNWVEADLMVKNGDFFELTVAGQFWQTRLVQHLLDYARQHYVN